MSYVLEDRSTWSLDAQRVALRHDQGLWSKGMVKMAVRKGIITKEQYEEITGEVYA